MVTHTRVLVALHIAVFTVFYCFKILSLTDKLVDTLYICMYVCMYVSRRSSAGVSRCSQLYYFRDATLPIYLLRYSLGRVRDLVKFPSFFKPHFFPSS